MIINGEEMNFAHNLNIEDILNKLNVNKDNVVVEMDLNIIKKENYKEFYPDESSKIEIINFVGGG
ncbi:MAG: sulfur carrier protein ThiS [Peptostreptococcaceae bacterium]|jgi:sulfur carrier protein|nr:sulfur carrier protein ThiS [Peptostreptococcaceae bacterium]